MSYPTSAHRDKLLCWTTFAAVLVLKIVFIAENEVVSSDYDGLSYVTLASAAEPWRVIGGTPPGYSLWLWLGKSIAMPQRILIDVFYVTCCAVFARGIGIPSAGFKGFAAVLAVTAFSPVTFFLFDQTLSDGFYLCLSLLGCGLAARLIVRAYPRPRLPFEIIVLGLTFGLMDLTRREAPVTIVIYSALTVALLTRFRYVDSQNWKRSVRKSLAIVATTAVTAWLVGFAVLLEHERTEGVRAYTFAEIPSHLALLTRLASIETGEPPLRFIPITHRARQLAYEVSPTFKKFEAGIEDRSNVHQTVSYESLGKPGEVGAGWIWHLVNAVGLQLGYHTARDLDVVYRRVNEELDAAFASDRLKKHFVIHPLIGAPSTWLPHFMESLQAVAARSWQAIPPQKDAGIATPLFDRVCLRRASLVPTPSTLLAGWAFALPGLAVTVFASDGSGVSHRLTPTVRIERSDVRDGSAKEGLIVPAATGFWKQFTVDDPASLRLEIHSEDGEILTSGPLLVGKTQTIHSTQGHDVRFGLDAVPGTMVPRASGWRTSSMTRLADIYRAIPSWIAILLCLPILAYLLLGIGFRERSASLAMVTTVIFILMWIGARLVLYAIVDSAAWMAEPRYVTGVSVIFFGVAVACLMGTLVKLARFRPS